VTKPDDSTLTADDLRVIEKRAKDILNRASAWGRFPTPIEDILAAALLKVAPHSMFDPARIVAFARKVARGGAQLIMKAISKVRGLYDAAERIIHIDNTVIQVKQNFLTLHETGHHEIPTHRRIFRFFEDCEKTLAPETAEQFNREANNFARYALFQGTTFAQLAADCTFGIKTPMALAKKFGASLYASMREYARSNHRACVVYILEPIEYVKGSGAQAAVRRIEPSPAFIERFGRPEDTVITLDHVLGPLLPLRRKMTGLRSLALLDLNGTKHECVAEAFNTTYNILILLYPVRALTTSTIILPTSFKKLVKLGGSGT
jgi:Zn-dependent peptidase ImmA (M78 family)